MLSWAKKVSAITTTITLSTAYHLAEFLAHVHYRKLATRGYIHRVREKKEATLFQA